MDKALKIHQHLNNNSSLRRLKHQIHASQRLLEKIQTLLPESLSQHCTAASWQGKTVVIQLDASVWATRMRFHTETLLEQLGCERIRLRVLSHQKYYDSKQLRRPVNYKSHPKHSSVAGKHILDVADATSDGKLRSALKRLSAAVEKK